MRAGELNPWWRIGTLLTLPLVRGSFRVRLAGLEHVPSAGPAILAFNHVSALDGPVLAIEVAWRLRRQTRFLVAAEFFERRRFRWVLRSYEQIPVHRGEGNDIALDRAIETVRRGAMAAISPEGRVNDGDPTQLQRIRSGVARVALATGASIVPVGIWGTQHRWPRSGLRYGPPWRPRLAIAFGNPILPASGPDSADALAHLSDRLRDRLEAQVAQARAMTGETA